MSNTLTGLHILQFNRLIFRTRLHILPIRIAQSVVICLLGAGLSSCALFTPPATPVAIELAPTTILILSETARSRLAAAEQRIIDARAAMSLWTSATAQLALARNAAIALDNEGTILHANAAIALSERSIAQAKLPPISW